MAEVNLRWSLPHAPRIIMTPAFVPEDESHAHGSCRVPLES